MNRFSQFWRKMFPGKQTPAPKEQHFQMDAKPPEEDKRRRFGPNPFVGLIRRQIQRRKDRALNRANVQHIANPQSPIKSWKPLPKYIEVGWNRTQSQMYRHSFRVPCSKHPKIS